MPLKLSDTILDPQPDGSSFSKSVGTALAVVSIAGSVFVAGYNWRSVSIVEQQQEQFVRKDVQREQLANINDRLTEISKQLERAVAELEKERRRPQ